MWLCEDKAINRTNEGVLFTNSWFVFPIIARDSSFEADSAKAAADYDDDDDRESNDDVEEKRWSLSLSLL